MLLSLTKKRRKSTLLLFATTKQKKQQHIIAPALQYRWKCYHEVALNYQQVGPTFLAPLSLD